MPSKTNVAERIDSMDYAMHKFSLELEEKLRLKPKSKKLKGARWAYRIAMSQFYNRFNDLK